MNDQQDHRRLGRFQITPEFLVMLGTGIYEVVDNPLPDDAKIVQAGYDAPHGYLYVTLQSQALAVVEEGGIIPFLRPPCVRRLEVTTCP